MLKPIIIDTIVSLIVQNYHYFIFCTFNLILSLIIYSGLPSTINKCSKIMLQSVRAKFETEMGLRKNSEFGQLAKSIDKNE